jgi:hypothetical protein
MGEMAFAALRFKGALQNFFEKNFERFSGFFHAAQKITVG